MSIKSIMTALANAVRSKTGATGKMNLQQMADRLIGLGKVTPGLVDRSITTCVIPNSATGIGDYAFRGCESLSSVTIPISVTSIGYYAFRDCRSLASITIPSSVRSIRSDVFYSCSSLTDIYCGFA